MTIKKFKNIFKKELLNLYPKQEIDNFFYLLTYSFLNLNRIDLALDPNLEIVFEAEQKYHSALAKLKKEIPIQYILGATEFYGLNFKVDANVLIPRPETEELVKWVIEGVESRKLKVKSEKLITNNKFRTQTTNLNIIDIGTGSGCIAIALAKNISNATIWALDISDKALEVAKYNAKLNGVDIQFLHKDILNTKKFSVKFDLIISNPPYVRELEKHEINNNVLQYEPHLALFVKNENALIFYDKIADLAKKNLNKNGQLYFEINQYFGNETKALLLKKGFRNIALKKDIFKNDRMIKAAYLL
ncbi:MAG: peptide chain release factor N(5)-glutamine methyltransferase [Flavobacteriaceae bacterium]|nr:peptide chain release factor N(5)-glutamine methyltransferase [Flavobacteriaceae bacterium]